MALDVATLPDRLNLGCGFDHREGYLNVDFVDGHHPDLIADVRDLSALPDGHFAEVLAIDVLEHLPRTDTACALAEWYRLLRPGGVLHIQVPDLLGLTRMVLRNDNVDQHREVLHLLFGTQAYTGDFHQTSFTDLTLIEHLRCAGFGGIVLQGRHAWMFDAEATKPALEEVDDLAVSWGEGFHSEESSSASRWRWAQPEAELLLVNLDPRAMEVTIQADVRAGGEGWMTYGGGGVSGRIRMSTDSIPIEFSLALATGGTRFRFSCGTPPLRVPDDSRVLAACFADVRFRQGTVITPARSAAEASHPNSVFRRLAAHVRRRAHDRLPLKGWRRP